jgi:hypothetical protein
LEHLAATIFRVLESKKRDAANSPETPVTIYHFTRCHTSIRDDGGGVGGIDVDDDGCIDLNYAINLL